MKTFDYFRPSSLEEAVSLYDTYGAKAKLLAGGTDLVVMIDDGMVAPDYLIDLKSIEELKRIDVNSESLFVGSNVTFSDLIRSSEVREKAPALWEASKTVASVGVRNRATLVGNICSAVPSADSAPPLLVLKAIVVVRGRNGVREVPIEGFFTGPRKTILEIPDIVVGIKIPTVQEKSGSCYVKLGRYDGEDLAQVSVAALVDEFLNYRIAFGAVAPTPVRAYEAEKQIQGKSPDSFDMEHVISIALESISPISDVRASKEYRMHVSGVLLKRALLVAYARLNGNGPAYGESLI